MSLVAAAVLGALVGLGVLLVINGLRGRTVLPSAKGLLGTQISREMALLIGLGALLAGLVVYLATGWPVAAAGAAVSAALLPRSIGVRNQHNTYVARTNAIASWTEMIRDNMAGAAGLEQALQASVTVAPEAIAPELERFHRQLDQGSLADALTSLGRDLDHPSADLVVAALTNAAVMEARELGPLLGRLASATRADTRMRERVEVGRARIRTSARIVVATTALTILLLWIFARELLAAYSGFYGQLWMCVVAMVFVVGGLVLRTYSQFATPDRFQLRHRDRADELTPEAVR